MDLEEKELEQIIDDSYSDDSLLNLISYGIDLTVREINTMLDEDDLVKPRLQRNYVWTKKEASRFIDSILLGLPVPSLFLAKDTDEKLLIVDGLQRITTLYDFIHGTFSRDGSKFKLYNSDIINEKWRNVSFDDLAPELQRRIKSYSIHAIIFERKDRHGNDTAIYQVFERINTGGRVLTHQEIRNCVYHGDFNDLLIELAEDTRWVYLVGGKNDVRLKNAELVLRCFAIKDMVSEDIKVINLNKYLNEYMSKYRDMSVEQANSFRNLFSSGVSFVFSLYETIYEGGNYEPSLPLVESLMVSYLLSPKKETIEEYGIDKDRIALLRNDEQYKAASTARTTNVTNIRTRINRCLQIVFGVERE